MLLAMIGGFPSGRRGVGRTSPDDSSPKFARAALLMLGVFALLVGVLHTLPAPWMTALDGRRFLYDWRIDFMSEFVRTPYAPLMTLAFFALAMAAGLLSAASARRGWTFEAGCFAAAMVLGLVLGCCRTDLAFGRESRSWIGGLHNPTSTLLFAPFALAFLRSARRREMPGLAAIALGGVALLALLLIAAYLYLPITLASHPDLAESIAEKPWTGLMQRAVAAPGVLWLIGIAARLAVSPKKSSATTSAQRPF